MSNAVITGQALDELRAAIKPLDTETVRARYRARDFPRADAVVDLDRRYRFDLFYAVWGARRPLPYEWANDYTDRHIETALRAVVAPLGES